MKRRLLFCSACAGAETVHQALVLARRDDVWPIDELHVFATSLGGMELEKVLFDSPRRQGLFAKWCRELRIARDSVNFNRRSIHAADTRGIGLETKAGVDAMGNVVFATLRDAAGQGAELIVGLDVGCPDAVGYLLLGALHVVGRAGDRACLIPDGTELPVLLSAELPAGELSQLVDRRRFELQIAATPALILLDDVTQTMNAAGIVIQLTPTEYFWYSSLATFAEPPPSLDDLRGLIDVAGNVRATQPSSRLFQHLEARFAAVRGLREECLFAFIHRATVKPPNLISVLSKLNKRITEGLGRGAAAYAMTTDSETRRYRVGNGITEVRLVRGPVGHPVRPAANESPDALQAFRLRVASRK